MPALDDKGVRRKYPWNFMGRDGSEPWSAGLPRRPEGIRILGAPSAIPRRESSFPSGRASGGAQNDRARYVCVYVSNPSVLGPPVSSKSHLPTGKRIRLTRVYQAFCVCEYVSGGQASESAEPALVIRVNGTQSIISISHSQSGAQTNSGHRSLYVCVCVMVSQASEAAEPIHVIRVNGAQSFTMIAPDPLGSSEPVFVCVCAAILAP